MRDICGSWSKSIPVDMDSAENQEQFCYLDRRTTIDYLHNVSGCIIDADPAATSLNSACHPAARVPRVCQTS